MKRVQDIPRQLIMEVHKTGENDSARVNDQIAIEAL
jgi:hypothetical protein